MPTYRLHKLDTFGKFQSSESIEADNDMEAVRAARAGPHNGGCEIWRARRLVGRILPQ